MKMVLVCFLSIFVLAPVKPTAKWKVGVALWSFEAFSFETALKKADSTGCKYIQGFSWQRLSKEYNNIVLGDASPEVAKEIRGLLDKDGLQMTSLFVGQTDKVDPAAFWKKYFVLANILGALYITCEPDKSQLDLIDSLAGIYKVKIAIHEHKQGSSSYWHPDSVLSAIKGHPNMGACADIGHWTRSKLDVVACLRKLKGHIFEIHLKDVNRNDEDVDVGTGIIDFKKVGKELKDQKFKGFIYVEDEHSNGDVETVRKVLDFDL